MLQMLVYILTTDGNDSFLTASIDAHIWCELPLLLPEPHLAAIPLVHLEQVLSKQARLRATCRLQNLNCTVALISIAFGKNHIDDVLSKFFNLLFQTFQLIFSNLFEFLIFVRLVANLSVFVTSGKELL